jgi:hypothetical protein
MADPEGVSISLTGDEALVLFELLHRWEDQEQVSVPRNEAEQVALWNLSAALEKVMREPFGPEYARLLSEAQARLTPTE